MALRPLDIASEVWILTTQYPEAGFGNGLPIRGRVAEVAHDHGNPN